MKKSTQELFDKAARSIQTAESLKESKDYEFIASRAYYAMFYIAEALLNEKDLSFKRHGSLHAAFGEHFVKTGIFDQKLHRWLIEAFNLRLTSDYSASTIISKEDAVGLIPQAQEFLHAARKYLEKLSA